MTDASAPRARRRRARRRADPGIVARRRCPPYQGPFALGSASISAVIALLRRAPATRSA